jgi:UPF0176 protein
MQKQTLQAELQNNNSNTQNNQLQTEAQKQYVVRAYYRFVELEDYEQLREKFLNYFEEKNKQGKNIKGTILLAREGINSTMSAPEKEMREWFEFLNADPRLANIPYKDSYSDSQPFRKMKVRLKKEIVRLGSEFLPFELDINKRGEYVKGEDWDKLISDPEVITIDTRNEYEILLGTFEGAVNPHTNEFRNFPKWVDENLDKNKHKKVAMFCTGGIRCEKSTSLLKNMGFENVYHLDGGILQYLEDTNNKNGKWQGSCFVFDDRVAVDDHLVPAKHIRCKKCGNPITIDEVVWGANQKGVTCAEAGQYCVNHMDIQFGEVGPENKS